VSARARSHETFDAIVIGAGPAGSTCAYFLARSGVSTLLVDRAAFPRDKPCGGGITARAASLLPFSLDPVVEKEVDQFEIGLSYGKRFVRVSEHPLVHMTERLKLDAFLLSKAIDAGAIFREGTSILDAQLRHDGASVHAESWAARARAVIGADGANGTTSRRLGIARDREHLVALEADIPIGLVDRSSYEHRLVLELGTARGGYSWIFPKLDHLNVGVVGWKTEGPQLRTHLYRLVRALDVDQKRLERVRGYRLPLRAAGDPLSKASSIVIGDAAGLIDPLSGEGMHSAFLSAKLGSEAVVALVEGRASDLRSYENAVLSSLGSLPATSWGCKAAFDRFPRASYSFLRTPQAWHATKRIFQGRRTDNDEHLLVPTLLARLGGDPGRHYRLEVAGPRANSACTGEPPPRNSRERGAGCRLR
jgi:geranylgeranyl reductase family protein